MNDVQELTRKPTIIGMYLINISYRVPTAEIYICCGQNALVHVVDIEVKLTTVLFEKSTQNFERP